MGANPGSRAAQPTQKLAPALLAVPQCSQWAVIEGISSTTPTGFERMQLACNRTFCHPAYPPQFTWNMSRSFQVASTFQYKICASLRGREPAVVAAPLLAQISIPMLRLIYTSHVQPPVDTASLLEQARRDNHAKGITGGLAVLDGVFLQYLEGEAEDVDALFTKIGRDGRHRDVKVLERRVVDRRMFADWSMATLEWTEETRNIFCSFSPGTALDLYQTDPTTAAPMFRAWAATSAWKN